MAQHRCFIKRLFEVAFITMLVLTGVASAHQPDGSVIQSSALYLKAGNTLQKATISVRAMNGTTPLYPVTINFSVDNASMGTLTKTFINVNATSWGVTTLTSKTIAGNVTVTAIIKHDGLTETKQIIIPVDHGTPTATVFLHPAIAPAASMQFFNLTGKDAYGNACDNRINGNHSVEVHMDCGTPLSCGWIIWGSRWQDAEATLAPDGFVSVPMQVSSAAGSDGIISMAMDSLPDYFGEIEITEMVTPTPTPTLTPTPTMTVTTTPIVVKSLTLSNFTVAEDSDFVYGSWNVSYTGIGIVLQEVYVIQQGKIPKSVQTLPEGQQSCYVDLFGYPYGEYRLKIKAQAPDVVDSYAVSQEFWVGEKRTYIKLE